MARPTIQQRKELADFLEALKPTVREKTIFGDSNHECIDLQIRILRSEVNSEDIETMFEDEEITENQYSCAGDAFSWIDGTLDHDLIGGWKELATVKGDQDSWGISNSGVTLI
jgi:hypothetical protein